MSTVMTTLRGFIVSEGGASMVVTPEGDDVATFKIHGKGSPRDWYMLGCSLALLGQSSQWEEPLASSLHPTGYSYASDMTTRKHRGGIAVSVATSGGDPYRLVLQSAGMLDLRVSGDGYLDREQMETLGALLINVISRCLRAPLSIFGPSELREFVETEVTQ